MARLLVSFFLGIALPVSGTALDLDLYGALLRDHTRQTRDLAAVRVDYAALRSDPRWPALVSSLQASDPAGLAQQSQRLAFWLNAYNILAIDMVVRHAPPESIRDIGSFFSPVWKRTAGTIAGKPYSLDAIEHEIVRPMGEPRAHVAVICASLSCPPLRREPWRAEILDDQLDDQLRTWLTHPEKGLRVDRERGAVHLSRIFEWFAEDFDASGGVLPFVIEYAPPEDAAWLQEHGPRLHIRYLDYDWKLNTL